MDCRYVMTYKVSQALLSMACPAWQSSSEPSCTVAALLCSSRVHERWQIQSFNLIKDIRSQELYYMIHSMQCAFAYSCLGIPSRIYPKPCWTSEMAWLIPKSITAHWNDQVCRIKRADHLWTGIKAIPAKRHSIAWTPWWIYPHDQYFGECWAERHIGLSHHVDCPQDLWSCHGSL